MNVLTVTLTDRGAAIAARLPFEHHHGDLVATVRSRWSSVDALVLVCATGIAVRAIAPLLRDKHEDPAVVCVDDGGTYVVALTGGHTGGANDLARRVAAHVGATAVVTTATDGAGMPALDALPGVTATGDIAAVTRALLDGRPPIVDNELGWPLAALPERGDGPERVVVTDLVTVPEPSTAVLHPPSLVVGVGASRGVSSDEVRGLVDTALGAAGLAAASVAEVATVDVKADEPGILALGWPVRTYAADTLARVAVPNPSDVVASAVGTSSVAEAACLLAAGPDAELVVEKQRSAMATVAVARRRRPRGALAVVGVGPGDVAHRTPSAERAIRRADVVIGYAPYVDLCSDLLGPAQRVVRSPIGAELDRARAAVHDAAAGARVAVVCSGDAGVYAMASLVFEVAAAEGAIDPADIEVQPGITASLAAGSVLGAPLGHDHVSISLSDLLTPWPVIERRVRAAAEADLVVCFYNPRSRGRDWQLEAARTLLLEHRATNTPVGVVTDVGRATQTAAVTTLAELDVELVGMTTLVVVGSSTTFVAGGRMITPRGYGR